MYRMSYCLEAAQEPSNATRRAGGGWSSVLMTGNWYTEDM